MGQSVRAGLYTTVAGLLWALMSALMLLRGGSAWDEALLLGLPLAVVGAAIAGATRYPSQALPLGSAPFGRALANHVATILVSTGLWLLSGSVLARLLGSLPRYAGTAERFAAERPTFAVVGLLVFLLAVVASYLARALESAHASEVREVEARALAREAELRALRAQLDPHFLFNSLNSIAALTGDDPAAARRMCLLLAQFMRASLVLGARERITFEEELGLVGDYLMIEGVRFGDRLRLRQEIEADCRPALVPPLLLQPIVENAVRHGIAQVLAGGTLSIAARREGDALSIRIDNPRDPERAGQRGAGLGLDNVRGRLRNLYGNAARVDVAARGEAFSVMLLLPFRTAPGSGRAG